MKRYILVLIAIAAVLSGCTKESDPAAQQPLQEDGVKVSLGLGIAGIETGTGIEPMGRAHNSGINRSQVFNTYEVILMKRFDNGNGGYKWIVDQILHPVLDRNVGNNIMFITDGQIFDNFEMILRPGTYRALAVINHQSLVRNGKVVEGLVVQDDSNPIPVPMAFTYTLQREGWIIEEGDLSVGSEIFAGFAEFEVEKQKELTTPGHSQIVAIEAERRTTPVAIWLKDTPESPANFQFTIGSNQNWWEFTTEDPRGFCNGIDMYGNAWYSDPARTVMTTTQWFTNKFLTTLDGQSRYAIPAYNSRYYNIYFFTDPEDTDGVNYNIGGIEIDYQDGHNYRYFGPNSINRTLMHNVPDAIGVYPDYVDQASMFVILDFVSDDSGEVANLSDQMSPYVYWNF